MTRIVGIVGGMGPLATQAFYAVLIRETSATRDQDHLHVIIDADASIPDRTAYLLGCGEDPRPSIIAAARRLVAAGAEILVMPCNTASVWTDEIAAATSALLIPWHETAVATVSAIRPRTVGLLATTGSVRVGAYERLLEARGMDVLLPTTRGQSTIMAAIYGRHGVKGGGRVSAENRSRLIHVAESLIERGADVLLLACTELPLAIAAGDPAWRVPVVDPAVEVARATIVAAGGTPLLRPSKPHGALGASR